MKINILDNNILQFFGDVAYYVTPISTKTYKIFSILGFNIKEKKLNNLHKHF